jgi:hypothetical protein
MFIFKMYGKIYWWSCLDLQLKEIGNYVWMGWYTNKFWKCFLLLKIHNMKTFLEEEMFFAI